MEKKWAELSPEERREERFREWRSPPGVEFTNSQAERTYQQRVTRLIDAIKLREPDRVPVGLSLGFFPAFYSGLTPETVMYDYRKLSRAWLKFARDFDVDVFFSPGAIAPGKALEILDYKLYRWPGHGTSPITTYQCVEAEYMTADEYDHLIYDPSDFWMRVYLPRIFGTLAPLKKLSPLTDIIELPVTAPSLAPLGGDDVQAALRALLDAGTESLKWWQVIGECNKAAMASGFPLFNGGMAKAPFDTIGDTLRGTHGVMMDMYRQPDKLLEAMERITIMEIKRGVSGANASRIPVIFIPLHKGADGFMSDEQFRTFYWPTLKKVILGLIEEGLVPSLFAEGGYNSRLEVIRDLPQGKVVWHFDQTDMAQAKEVLGGTACIMGNIPSSLLFSGTQEGVKDYCRRLIEVAGKGGGFILDAGAVIDEARPENVRAVFQAAKDYGVYRRESSDDRKERVDADEARKSGTSNCL